MFMCSICGAGDSREEFVEEVFRINGKPVPAEDVRRKARALLQ